MKITVASTRPGPVEAVCVGPFALHPSQVVGDWGAIYTLTHIATGYAVRTMMEWGAAVRLLDLLIQHTDIDWTFTAPDDARRIRDAVAALCEEAGCPLPPPRAPLDTERPAP